VLGKVSTKIIEGQDPDPYPAKLWDFFPDPYPHDLKSRIRIRRTIYMKELKKILSLGCLYDCQPTASPFDEIHKFAKINFSLKSEFGIYSKFEIQNHRRQQQQRVRLVQYEN
jgi:hypothetical protein